MDEVDGRVQYYGAPLLMGPLEASGATLRAECQLPATPDPAFDRFARLASAQLDVPMSLVTLVSRQGQVFPGALGLPEPYQKARQAPLTHTVCQHVVLTRRTLLLEDIRVLPWLADSLATPELGVVAYAGAPLTDADGDVVGSLCAIDGQPRTWTPTERDVLQDLAAACSSELALRQLRERADAALVVAAQASASAAIAHSSTLAAENRARLLLSLAEGLADVATVDDVVTAVSRLTHSGLGTTHAGIAVRDQDTGKLSYRTADSFSAASRAHWASVPQRADIPTAVAVASGEPRYYHDHQQMLAEHTGLIDAPVLTGDGARAALPLHVAGTTVGALFLGWPHAQEIDSETRAVLAALARYTAQAIARAQLIEQRRAVAETLQRAMLTELPDSDHLQLHARYVPAANTEQVGGDWYDAVVLPDGVTTLLIGDVVGHDMRAAAAMGQLRAMTRTLAWTYREPPSLVLQKVDQAMAGLRAQSLATALMARIEQSPADAAIGMRRLSWSSAGHPPPLLLDADGSATFLSGHSDLPLGILVDAERHDHQAGLPPGSTLLLFTDGLVERRHRGLHEGMEVLRLAVEQHAQRP
ncbi:MAG: GAF domain-containing SpoIIE family protein phosphatase, partial [Janthinobacterium lividum]